MSESGRGARAGRITWIAGYPKSGSTWLRAFLSVLLDARRDDYAAGRVRAPLCGLLGKWAMAHSLLNRELGVNSVRLSTAEIDRLRPLVYRSLCRRSSETVWLKTHEGLAVPDPGRRRVAGPLPVRNPAVTQAVIYLLRNPLDVAVSYAHHLGCDLSQSVAHMLDRGHRQGPDGDSVAGGRATASQRIGRWDEHVRHWTALAAAGTSIPTIVLRYEDLLTDPLSGFSRLLDGLGLDADPKAITTAIEATRFERLRSAERHGGFGERPVAAGAFFRVGRAGEGRQMLSPALQDRLSAEFAGEMRRFGYL